MRVTHIMTRSADRDREVYPSSSSYRITLPKPYKRVSKVQISTLELPSSHTHMTIEAGVNDRVWFSEGLKVDLGESPDDQASPTVVHSDVDGISGLNLSNNQLCIRENGTTAHIVSVPSYLCPITSVDPGTGVVTTLDPAGVGVYQCYEAWRLAQTRPSDHPRLHIVCPQTTYHEVFDGSAVSTPGDASLFSNAFVHCPPLSIEEICSYLTFAFKNFTTYFSGTAPTNEYRVQYLRGLAMIFAVAPSTQAVKLHFPRVANIAITEFYGTQPFDFGTRTAMNSSGSNVTSVGYLMGFRSNTSMRTFTALAGERRGTSGRTYTGFLASVKPRFVFEARLLPGYYTTQALATYLPIAMNPLYFSDGLNPDTHGACYFGFRDSRGVDKLAIINSGQYTVESFCQALGYLLTRLDSQGVYHSTSRFAYRDTPLDGDSGARPGIDFGGETVVYNVRYDFTTSKFTIESSYTNSAQVNDPSGNVHTLDTTVSPPRFSLFFHPTTLAKIAAKVTDLSTLCTSSNVDRIANVLGFEIQDYVDQASFESTMASYIPRIPCTLSQGVHFAASRPRWLGYQYPDSLGLSSAPNGAGPPAYFTPSGQYATVGNSPSTQNLNLCANDNSGLLTTLSQRASVASDTLKVTVANDGQIAGDYTVSNGGSVYSTTTFVVGDATYTSPVRPGSAIFQVDGVAYASGSAASSLALVDVGAGLSTATDVSFNTIPSYGPLRKGVVNTSTADTSVTFSSHIVTQSTTSLAMSTTRPVGFQVGDVVVVGCAQDALVTSTVPVVATVTVSAVSVGRGIPGSSTYTHTGATTLVEGNYHIVLGGDYNGVLKVTTGGAAGVSVLTVIEPGRNYYSGDTYSLSQPIRFDTFTGVVIQHPNSGGQFLDTDNSSNELFYTSLPVLTNSSDTTPYCVAARSCDGATVRVRVPSHLRDNGFGHADVLKRLTPVRVDFHVEDWDTVTRRYSAHDVVGIGKSYLPIQSNPVLPNDVNVSPVPYILVCFKNLSHTFETQVADRAVHEQSAQNVVGKVVLGAETAITKTSPLTLELHEATLQHIDIEFRLPNNRDLYNFHGRDHSLTLSIVEENFKASFMGNGGRR